MLWMLWKVHAHILVLSIWDLRYNINDPHTSTHFVTVRLGRKNEKKSINVIFALQFNEKVKWRRARYSKDNSGDSRHPCHLHKTFCPCSFNVKLNDAERGRIMYVMSPTQKTTAETPSPSCHDMFGCVFWRTNTKCLFVLLLDFLGVCVYYLSCFSLNNWVVKLILNGISVLNVFRSFRSFIAILCRRSKKNCWAKQDEQMKDKLNLLM